VQVKSPAATSGIRIGDLVTVFDGLDVRNSRDLSRLVSETPPGRTVNVTIVRDGRARTVKVTPAPGR
jgi:serine protease Do